MFGCSVTCNRQDVVAAHTRLLPEHTERPVMLRLVVVEVELVWEPQNRVSYRVMTLMIGAGLFLPPEA